MNNGSESLRKRRELRVANLRAVSVWLSISGTCTKNKLSTERSHSPRVHKFEPRGYTERPSDARATAARPRAHTRVRAVCAPRLGAALTVHLAFRRYPFMPRAGTVKKTGHGRHGYGRAQKQKPANVRGENGKQAAGCKAASAPTAAPVGARSGRCKHRSTRCAKPKPAAKAQAGRTPTGTQG